MSKMSELHTELTEQACELGFESLEEALANGYEVDYEARELVNPYVLSNKAHEEAHEAWLAEKQAVLLELKEAVDYMEDYIRMPTTIPKRYVKAVRHAIEFIARGEC